MSDAGLPFVKGHGTGNDFVLIPDLRAELDLTPALVAAVCDRRTGLGADGVLRVVPDRNDPTRWFMDYRNADGSLAQMCGNGARVFARYLVDAGLVAAGRFEIGTRAGVKAVEADVDGPVTVDMGPAIVDPRTDLTVLAVDRPGREWPAVGVDMGNRHAVAFVDDLAAAGRLFDPPVVAPADAFPQGVNVEFALVAGPARVQMRVFERGVGQTQSCGTGACAVFAAARLRAGADPSPTWTVDVPGGTLHLTQRADGGIDLRGPAELVATGTLDGEWLSRQR